MNKYRIAAILLAGLAFPLLAEPPSADVKSPEPGKDQCEKPADRPAGPQNDRRPRSPERESGRRFRNGPGMWQVFAQLTPEERREMQKLQREDPEKFLEVMHKKADELFRKRKERREHLQKLAEQCRNAATPEERERLKKLLTEEVKNDFRAHLKANRRQLEDMKRRAEHLEKELQRRENNIDKAVEVHVDALIQGKRPPRRQDSRRFGREPLEK